MQIKIEIIGTDQELAPLLSYLSGTGQIRTGTQKPMPVVKELSASTDSTKDNSEEEKEDKVIIPTVTFEQLREMIASKNKTPDRKGKALIAKFGFTKLDEVRPRPDLWDEMYAKAKAL